MLPKLQGLLTKTAKFENFVKTPKFTRKTEERQCEARSRAEQRWKRSEQRIIRRYAGGCTPLHPV